MSIDDLMIEFNQITINGHKRPADVPAEILNTLNVKRMKTLNIKVVRFQIGTRKKIKKKITTLLKRAADNKQTDMFEVLTNYMKLNDIQV